MENFDLEGDVVLTPEYTCLECGESFDDPQKYTERHGLETPPYETFTGCPRCGGAYANTIICDGCGKPIIGEYVKILPNGECYCESCYLVKMFGE